MFDLKNEKFQAFVFFAILTIVLTWPTVWNFFSSVPSYGADTMQVIGVAGERANFLKDQSALSGTIELAKRSEFNVITLYAYFFLLLGRIAGYNILFFLSFILSGFGAYLLARHFVKSKPAALLAGIIFAFSPFHFHNALSTNVGTMHQEWLPFFALYLFKFFENLKFRYFVLSGFLLLLIGFTEHQLLAFTVLFILLFLAYKLFSDPKAFLRPKLWLFAAVSAVILSVAFFFMFRPLLSIAGSADNYLDAGFKSAVKYSNDSLAILIPPSFHTFWPNALSDIRNSFERKTESNFSIYAGYAVLILSILGISGMRFLKKRRISASGIFFWLATAVVFWILSLGPHLHYMGVMDPPVKMPYLLVYNHLPFYENIRTVGRFFVWSMLGWAILASFGAKYLMERFFPVIASDAKEPDDMQDKKGLPSQNSRRGTYFCVVIGLIIVLEFLPIPLKTNSLLHSSFYEKLGEDKSDFSILEVPGNTDYDFASRALVWKSIHRKNTVNGYEFARVIEGKYDFQRGTPIVRTLLYDIPEGGNENDRDLMKDSYYNISSEILNFYNIRWLVLDKEGLKGDASKGELNMLYPAKAYIENVIKCSEKQEDEYVFACKVDESDVPEHLFLAMDYSNKHWVGKSRSKNGLQRWAESGAGLVLVNMTSQIQKSELNFNVKVAKPLRIRVLLNGKEAYNKYITSIDQKQYITVDLEEIHPGENEIIYEVLAADGSHVRTEKKSDSAVIYQVEVIQPRKPEPKK